MKITCRLILCILLATMAGPCFAGDGTLVLGSNVYYYQYREPLFAKLVGETFGLTADYTYKFGKFLFAQADAEADFGTLDYSSDGTGSSNGFGAYTQEGRLLFGAGAPLTPNFLGSFYTGAGYRRLFDNKGPGVSTAGSYGYDRLSQYFYIPFGASFTFPVGQSAMSFNAEADYLVEGEQDSYLRDLGFDNNVSNTQKTGYGLRGGINFVPESIPYLSFGIFARYWNIGDSNYKPVYVRGVLYGYGLEPGNNTLETGLQAKLRL
jgi:hypothetical protein